MNSFKTTIFAIIAILFINSLYADDKNAIKGKSNESKNDIIAYGLKVKHQVNTYFRYKLTEISEVKRSYSDSSIKEYKREVDYFLTAKVPESPRDGFQTLMITVDSLIYKLNDGGSEYYFNARTYQEMQLN